MKEPYNYALKLLSNKDYSSFNLRNKLESKFEEYNSEEIIHKLIDKKLLNDCDYALRKSEVLIKKNYSDSYILNKLEAEELYISTDKLQLLREELNLSTKTQIKNIINNKMSLLKDSKKTTEQKVQKVSAYLASKGYSFEEIETHIEGIK